MNRAHARKMAQVVNGCAPAAIAKGKTMDTCRRIRDAASAKSPQLSYFRKPKLTPAQ